MHFYDCFVLMLNDIPPGIWGRRCCKVGAWGWLWDVVSYAKFLVVTARGGVVAVVVGWLVCGSWDVQLGHGDYLAPNAIATEELPSPDSILTKLKGIFSTKGFTMVEMVALSRWGAVGFFVIMSTTAGTRADSTQQGCSLYVHRSGAIWMWQCWNLGAPTPSMVPITAA